ncbi:MAG: gamma carbonic anhydrase family protein [Spirochaetota bacterium]|nr:gamma carbonic anhydrase family protein [Spirochaetota bacterium]
MTYDFTQRHPEVHADSFIAEGAHVIGRVILEKGVSIWHNTVLRADINDIRIGENSNIQDNTVIHVSDPYPAIVGSHVTVGHSVIIHACTVGDYCLIGMGSVIMDGAVIGKNSIVGAGSLVSPGKSYPEGSLIIGSPAKVLRPLRDDEIDGISHTANKYINVWQAYVKGGIPAYSGKREIRIKPED